MNRRGKRKGSFAMYLEPGHADVFDFLEPQKHHNEGAQQLLLRILKSQVVTIRRTCCSKSTRIRSPTS